MLISCAQLEMYMKELPQWRWTGIIVRLHWLAVLQEIFFPAYQRSLAWTTRTENVLMGSGDIQNKYYESDMEWVCARHCQGSYCQFWLPQPWAQANCPPLEGLIEEIQNSLVDFLWTTHYWLRSSILYLPLQGLIEISACSVTPALCNLTHYTTTILISSDIISLAAVINRLHTAIPYVLFLFYVFLHILYS